MMQTYIATISGRLGAFAAMISLQSEYILPKTAKLSLAAVYLPSEPLFSGIDFCFLPNIALIYTANHGQLLIILQDYLGKPIYETNTHK